MKLKTTRQANKISLFVFAMPIAFGATNKTRALTDSTQTRVFNVEVFQRHSDLVATALIVSHNASHTIQQRIQRGLRRANERKKNEKEDQLEALPPEVNTRILNIAHFMSNSDAEFSQWTATLSRIVGNIREAVGSTPQFQNMRYAQTATLFLDFVQGIVLSGIQNVDRSLKRVAQNGKGEVLVGHFAEFFAARKFQQMRGAEVLGIDVPFKDSQGKLREFDLAVSLMGQDSASVNGNSFANPTILDLEVKYSLRSFLLFNKNGEFINIKTKTIEQLREHSIASRARGNQPGLFIASPIFVHGILGRHAREMRELPEALRGLEELQRQTNGLHVFFFEPDLKRFRIETMNDLRQAVVRDYFSFPWSRLVPLEEVRNMFYP